MSVSRVSIKLLAISFVWICNFRTSQAKDLDRLEYTLVFDEFEYPQDLAFSGIVAKIK